MLAMEFEKRSVFSLILLLNGNFMEHTCYTHRRTALESKEMVAEMVHGFLLPEVEKKSLRLKGVCFSISSTIA